MLNRPAPVDPYRPLPDEDLTYDVAPGLIVEIRSGRTVTVVPSAEGRPTPDILWVTPNGQRLQPGDSFGRVSVLPDGPLQIVDATTADKGTYRVVATSRAGTDAQDVDVVVYPPVELTVVPGENVVVDRVPIRPTDNESFFVKENSELVITCGINGVPSEGIEWLIHGESARSSSTDGLMIAPTPAGSQLTLKSVQLSDAGSYVCSGGDATDSTGFQVDVVVIPSDSATIERRRDVAITRTSTEVTSPVSVSEIFVSKKQDLVIYCRSSGADSITWMKNGAPLTSGGRTSIQPDGTLRISQVESSDFATYKCTVTKGFQQDMQTTTVVESTMPVIPEPQPISPSRPLPDGDVTRTAGQTSEVTVYRTAFIDLPFSGRPLGDVKWILTDGRTLIPGQTDGRFTVFENGTLRIRNVQPEDAGSYRVSVSNVVGESSRNTEVVTYRPARITTEAFETVVVDDVPTSASPSKPVIVRRGGTISFEGRASGTPQPIIRFLKDGIAIEPSDRIVVDTTPTGGRITVRNASPDDNGRYTFVAENPSGVVVSSIDVEVTDTDAQPVIVRRKGQPTDDGKTVTATIGQKTTVNVGASQDLVLNCSAIATTEVMFVWEKDGEIILPNGRPEISTNGQTLTLRNVQNADAGRYVCRAMTDDGTDSESITVQITSEPEFGDASSTARQAPQTGDTTFEIGQAIDVVMGSTVRIRSPIFGRPTPSVTWILPSGRTLAPGERFDQFQVLDNGTLVIDDIRTGDAGSYTVSATSSLGETTSTSVVTVYVRPRLTSTFVLDGVAVKDSFGNRQVFPDNNDVVLVEISSTIALPCTASGLPLPSVRVLRDGDVIPIGGRYSLRNIDGGRGIELVIADVNDDDAGTYTCVAENDAGATTSSVVVRLSESGAPSINRLPNREPRVTEDTTIADVGRRRVEVDLGSRLTLLCTALGSSTTVSWYRFGKLVRMNNHFQLSSDDGSLTITKVAARDAGNFVCRATNPNGRDEEAIEVVPTRPPKVRRKPDGPQKPPGVNEVVISPGVPGVFNPGETLIFKDGTYGEPMPSVTWILPSGRRMNVGDKFDRFEVLDDGSLRVTNATPSDDGAYRFITTSVSGTDGSASNAVFVDPVQLTIGARDKITVSNRTVSPSPEGTLRVDVGSVFSMTCSATGSAPIDLSFTRDGTLIVPGGRIRVVSTDDNTKTLTIENVMPEDVGNYACVAVNSENAQETSVYVAVVDGAKIIREPTKPTEDLPDGGLKVFVGRESVTVVLGQTVEIMCNATGMPNPAVTWLLNEEPVAASGQVSQSGGTLTIQNIGRNDSEIYVCQAVNSGGSDREDIQVFVTEPPVIAPAAPIVVERPITVEDKSFDVGQTAEVSEGKSVTLRCLATGNPTPSTMWLLPSGDVLRPGDSAGRASVARADGSLTIQNAMISDSGRYECTATNTAGTDSKKSDLTVIELPEAQVTVTVQSQPVDPLDRTVKTRPQQVTLVCSVGGTLGSNAQWFVNGQRIASDDPRITSDSSSSTLAFTPTATTSDSGLYTCLIDTPGGTRGSSVRIDVSDNMTPLIIYDPEPTKQTPDGVETSIGKDSVTVSPGEILTISCDVAGSPEPTITWLRDGETITSGGRFSDDGQGTLVVSNVQRDDAGTYTCTANNTRGSDSDSIDVNVAGQ